MSARHLAIVTTPSDIDRSPESLSDRIHRLQAEARELAHGHIGLLRQTLAEVSRLAEDITAGGEAYPVGAREICRRLAEESSRQNQNLAAITERHVS